MLVLGYVRFTLNCRCRSCGVNDENVNPRPLMHNLKETKTNTSVFQWPFGFFIVDTIMNTVQRKLLHISCVLWYYILHMIICILVWDKYKRFWVVTDRCLPSLFLSLVAAVCYMGNLGITSLWGKNIAFRLEISLHGIFVKLYIPNRLFHVSLRLISSRIALIFCFYVALHPFSHS